MSELSPGLLDLAAGLRRDLNMLRRKLKLEAPAATTESAGIMVAIAQMEFALMALREGRIAKGDSGLDGLYIA